MEGSNDLYRPEAIAFVGARSLGSVEVSQPISFRLLTAGFLILTLMTLAFLFLGQYARTQAVSGFIEPKEGVVEVRASLSGVIQQVLVRENMLVEKDQPLLLVAGGKTLYDGVEENDLILEELIAQQSRIRQTMESTKEKYELDMEWNIFKEKSMTAEIVYIEQVIEKQRTRAAMYSEDYEAVRSLRAESFVSDADERTARSRYLSEEQTLSSLNQQLLNMNRELEQTRHTIAVQPLEFARESSVMENQLSDLAKEIALVRGQAEFVIKAPVRGRVTALTIKEGSLLGYGALAMNILPLNSDLHAVLVVPSSAAGFLETGQKVMLKYDSFPYQKFGAQEAVVSLVSEASISANEQMGSIITTQPSFVVYADLDSPSIQAYGEDRSIQPGMLLTAEIVLEERTLMEWILEPFYTLRGRVG